MVERIVCKRKTLSIHLLKFDLPIKAVRSLASAIKHGFTDVDPDQVGGFGEIAEVFPRPTGNFEDASTNVPELVTAGAPFYKLLQPVCVGIVRGFFLVIGSFDLSR